MQGKCLFSRAAVVWVFFWGGDTVSGLLGLALSFELGILYGHARGSFFSNIKCFR